MEGLEQLIREGTFDPLLDATAAWSDRQRREAGKWLAQFWKTHGGEIAQSYGKDQGDLWMRAVIAQVGAAPNAKKAMAIPPPRITPTYLNEAEPHAKVALVKAVARRGREFAASYVALGASGKRNTLIYVDVLLALIEGFGLPWPQDAHFGDYWAQRFYRLLPGRFPQEVDPPVAYQRSLVRMSPVIDGPGAAQPQVTEVIAHSPVEATQALFGLRPMMAALLARKDGVIGLVTKNALAHELDCATQTVAALVGNGALDRSAFAADIIAALTRGDSVTAQRLQVRFLLAAEPDAALIGVHMNTLHGLLASGHGSVAEAAQTLLRKLDDAQALDGEFFSSACQIVFARKEKGLRDEQLAWAARRLTRHPAQGEATRRGIEEALTVDDFTFRKKAELVAGLESAPRANEPAPAATVRSAPAPSAIAEGRPLARFTSLAPGAAAISEVMAEFGRSPRVAAVEHFIDLALRMARGDRKGLELALRGSRMSATSTYVDFNRLPNLIAEAAFFDLSEVNLANGRDWLLRTHGRDRPPKPAGWDSAYRAYSAMKVLPVVARMRFSEIGVAVKKGGAYAHVAKPGYDNGSIDSGEFVERMGALAAQRMEAGPMDLLVALMRTRHPGEEEVERLRAIGSRQTTIAANFFAAGGMGQMATTLQIVNGELKYHGHEANWTHAGAPEVCVSLSAMGTLPAIDGIPVTWSEGYTPDTAPDVWEFDLHEPYLTAVMPNNGEVLAALHLWGFRKAAGLRHGTASMGKATALALPAFTAARGPAGPAMHLAVLYSMSADEAPARIAGSDALAELIAQGRYDSALAAELVAAGVDCGSVKLGRLAGSLAQVAGAGTELILWPMVRAALAAALAKDPAPAGVPDLLAFGSGIASTLGLKERIESLARTAQRTGSSKMLTEARRLHELLTG
jgi:hypothetical protein